MEKHISPKKQLKHTYARKFLLSIYIIHNYIIYKSDNGPIASDLISLRNTR